MSGNVRMSKIMSWCLKKYGCLKVAGSLKMPVCLKMSGCLKNFCWSENAGSVSSCLDGEPIIVWRFGKCMISVNISRCRINVYIDVWCMSDHVFTCLDGGSIPVCINAREVSFGLGVGAMSGYYPLKFSPVWMVNKCLPGCRNGVSNLDGRCLYEWLTRVDLSECPVAV